MNEVRDYSTILNFISRIRESNLDYYTNFYFDKNKFSKLVEIYRFFYIKNSNTYFLIRENKGFFNLYYFAESLDSLSLSLSYLLNNYPNYNFVSDILSMKKDFEIKNIFLESGFKIYTTLNRMNKTTPGFMRSGECIDKRVTSADLNHLPFIYNLLDEFFDSIAEQLPSKQELSNLIKNNNVLIYEEENVIKGFLIFELKGLTLYLRYWFVHPNYRNQKVGSLLFKEFLFRGNEAKRIIFWVIESNYNAIKRYLHYGFQHENLYNLVITNKDNRYEG